MGCFSFICKESGDAVLSTSFSGTSVHLFLLKDGKVLEHMYGNYDSYGRVFDNNDSSFHWKMDWSDVCDLMFNDNEKDGIAAIIDKYYDNIYPTSQSEDNPNQGWGGGEDEEDLMGNTSSTLFEKVKEPFHKTFY